MNGKTGTRWKWMMAGLVLGALLGASFSALKEPQTNVPGRPASVNPDQMLLRKIDEGNRLAEEGRSEEAMALYQDLVDSRPGRPEPYNNLGALYAARGDLEASRRLLEEALRTDQSYAAIYDNLGIIYAEIARESYGRALRLDTPSTPPQLQMLASVADARKDPPQPSRPAAQDSPPEPPATSTRPEPSAPEDVDSPISAPPPVPAPAPAIGPAQSGEEESAQAIAATPNDGEETPEAAAEERPEEKAPRDSAIAEVREALSAWAAAWSRRDVPRYLGHYSRSFVPEDDQPRGEWEETRRVRLRQPEWIEVTLEEIRPEPLGENTFRVELLQNYRADHYQDRTRKAFILVREGGRWLIEREISLGPAS